MVLKHTKEEITMENATKEKTGTAAGRNIKTHNKLAAESGSDQVGNQNEK